MDDLLPETNEFTRAEVERAFPKRGEWTVAAPFPQARLMKRRIGHAIAAWLQRLSFRIEMWTAEPYDPAKWPSIELTDEEWDRFEAAMDKSTGE